jgi:glycosyltransferase involved in cell wall biosynthesis
MKVVHVTQPVEAGVAAVVLDLATDQRARGWTVDIVCPPSGWLAEQARERAIDVHGWHATREPGLGSVLEAVRLREVLTRLAPDVVHLHSSKAGLAGRLALRGRTPTLFQPHLWSFQSVDGLTRRACAVWEKLAARWTHQLVCVSEDELTAGRASGVTSPAEVICNGVDTDRFHPADRTAARRRLALAPRVPTAVCIGRVTRLKGQDQLLSAWSAVLERVPDAHLVLVGDGPMRDSWRDGHPMAKDPSVVWRGHSETAADFYAAADVVVLPSRAEGMALVPLEAMACARPVVAFDVGGVRQSVGDAGAIVSAGDIGGLADAVAARLADPVLVLIEGRRGRDRAVSLFDRGLMSEHVAVIVDKVIGEPTHAGRHR